MDTHFIWHLCNGLMVGLKKQRLLINITQSQLADKAGMGKSTIARVETGQGGTLENVIRIATALGLINELAGLFEPKANNIEDIVKQQNLPQRASRKHPMNYMSK